MAIPLIKLPIEVLCLLWPHIESTKDMNSFVQTCRLFYTLFNPHLYQHAVLSQYQSTIKWATEIGPISTMAKLISAGANPAGDGSYSPLREAARCGRTAMVCFILDQGICPLESNTERIVVYVAIQSGNPDVVRLILDVIKMKLPPEDYRDFLTRDAMGGAIVRGQTDMVELLCSEGADVNGYDLVEGMTHLARAIYLSKPKVVDFLIAQGASMDTELPDDLQAYYWVAYHGSVELATVLIARNFPADKDEGLAIAARFGSETIVKLLLEAGADPNSRAREETAIKYAAQKGSCEMVTMLLEAGAVGSLDELLATAACCAHGSLVALLLEMGAKDRVGNFGKSCLSHAIKNGDGKVVGELFKAGAHLHTGVDADTWLEDTVKDGHHQVLGVLLENGANAHFVTKDGYTLLSLAVQYQRPKVIITILDHVARLPPSDTRLREKDAHEVLYIDTPDRYNRTPLFHATICGNLDIVDILLSRGSSAVHISTESGRTPLSFARSNKDRVFNDARDGTLKTVWGSLSNPERVEIDINHLQDPIRDQSLDGIYPPNCDICKAVIPQLEDYIVCVKCGHGKTSYCGDCIARGASCTDDSHADVRTKETPPSWDRVTDPWESIWD